MGVSKAQVVIGFLVVISSGMFGFAIWMLGIRPYVTARKGTLVTAANWGVSAWADWQTCSEIARKKKDSKGRRLSNAFLFAQIGFVAGVILIFCGI